MHLSIAHHFNWTLPINLKSFSVCVLVLALKKKKDKMGKKKKKKDDAFCFLQL